MDTSPLLGDVYCQAAAAVGAVVPLWGRIGIEWRNTGNENRKGWQRTTTGGEW